ncbi:MAG TPA: hypothetical protein VFB80_00195 [Pirellulaceae bacterium]|nr:hypothetical protein [Pirellulaceae bacterium]
MPLTVQCTCGKSYQVDEALAGRRVKCKACGGALTIPQKPALLAAAADDEFRLAPLDDGPKTAVPLAAPAPAAMKAAALPAATPAAKAPAPQSAAAAAPSGSLPFFLAVSRGWSNTLIYRAYVDQGALLLIDLSPHNIMIDLEVARHADGSHWGVKTVQSLKTWMISSIAVVGSILGLLGIGIARAGFQRPNEALQLASFLFTVAAFAIPLLILIATWTMRTLVRRSQELDRLNADDLRRECGKGGNKYRLAAAEISELRVKPPAHPGGTNSQLAEATFKHPSGSWKLLLFAPQDVQLAVATFRRLLGGKVEVDPALERI